VKVVKQADGQPATIDIEGEPHQKQIIVNRLHKGEGSEGHDVQILEPSDLPKDAEGKPLRIRVPRVRVETHVIHGSEDPKAELAELQAEMKALQTRMEHLQKQMALAPLTPKGSKDKVPPPPPMPPPPPPAPPAPPVPEAPRATPAH
jgi:hypothetical protein